MSLLNRQTQQYLIAAGIILPLVLALYLVASWVQNQDIGVYVGNSKAKDELIVLKRNGTYERFWRTLPSGSLSVGKGKWVDGARAPKPNVLDRFSKPEEFLLFTGTQGGPSFMSKDFFKKPDHLSILQIEEARDSMGMQ